MTSAERALKNILEQLGYIVKPFSDRHITDALNVVYSQVSIGRYRVDFCLYQHKICLEADGEFWHTGYRKVLDIQRDSFLRQEDWKILRFSASTLEKNPDLAKSQLNRGLSCLMIT